MEKITLNLGEILQLESEINGFVNQNNGQVIYEGFLKQKLPIILKYDLNDVSAKLLEEKKLIEKVKDELITKYGEKTDDGIAITPFVDILDDEGNVTGRQYNENFIKFTNEYNQFLEDKSKEIECPVITKEDLKNAGESNDDYKILFKLVKK